MLHKISMQKRILYLFVISFMVYIVSLFLLLYNVYMRQVYVEITQRNDYEDGLLGQQIDNLIQNVESCSNNLIMEINLSMTGSGLKESSEEAVRDKILKMTEDNMLLFKEADEISILYDTGELFTKQRNGLFFSKVDHQLVQELNALDVDVCGIWHHWDHEGTAVYFVKDMREIRTNDRVGYILLKIEESTISKNFGGKGVDGASRVYVFDNSGYLLSVNQRELLEDVQGKPDAQARLLASREIYEDLIHKPKRYLVREYLNENGWKTVTILDTRQGMKRIEEISGIVIGGSALFLITFLIIAILLLNRILRPIVTIGNHMRCLGANPLSKIELPHAADEIGYLISSFNQMVDMNELLIRQVKADEQEKRSLELALIQTQIKPHFLYNTLDTAFCLNEIGMNKEASQVIKQLAGYYRLVLNRGSEWISLAEELSAVEKYLEIQAVRYRELIEYKIDVEEELYGFRIPKMTLQPLVENAIYHGIKPAGRPGHIMIRGKFCEDKVTISVTDDGVGMTKEEFADVINGRRTGTDKESFGVKSVSERLYLFYGENASVKLDKEMHTGTSIVLTIHLREGRTT